MNFGGNLQSVLIFGFPTLSTDHLVPLARPTSHSNRVQTSKAESSSINSQILQSRGLLETRKRNLWNGHSMVIEIKFIETRFELLLQQHCISILDSINSYLVRTLQGRTLKTRTSQMHPHCLFSEDIVICYLPLRIIKAPRELTG